MQYSTAPIHDFNLSTEPNKPLDGIKCRQPTLLFVILDFPSSTPLLVLLVYVTNARKSF